jgi:hypothetical protein
VGEHQKASIQSTMQHGEGIGINLLAKAKLYNIIVCFLFSSLKNFMLAWELGVTMMRFPY